MANRGAWAWRREGAAWKPLPTLRFQGSEAPQGALRSDALGHLYLLTAQSLYHLGPGDQAWGALPYRAVVEGRLLTQLRDGRVWVLQDGTALGWLGGRCTAIPLPADLSLVGRTPGFLDAEGNLWLTGSSLLRLPALGLVGRHMGPSRPPPKDVWQSMRDHLGGLWVGAEGGFFHLDGSGWRSLKGTSSPRRMDEAADGRIYLRDHGKFLRVDPRTQQLERVNIPLLGAQQTIKMGPITYGDRMWVKSADDRLVVGQWKGGTWSWAFENLPAFHRGLFNFIKDEQGRPWFTHSRRVFGFLGDKWEELPLPPEAQELVGLFSVRPDVVLVVQFQRPGVFSLTRGSDGWKAQTLLGPQELNGIGVIYGICQDSKGVLWLATEQGVIRVVLGSPPQFLCLNAQTGLPADDISQAGLLLEGDGRLWVGTARGFAEIATRQEQLLGTLSAPAQPSILEVRCGDWVSHASTPSTTIRPHQGSVVWELGFPGPLRGEGARFEFHEVGGTWAALAGTALQFPEISPGRHRYEVRMVPFLGTPGPARSLEIIALPPWYRHPAAYVVWILLLVGSVVLGVHLRILMFVRRNQSLQQAVEAATFDLNTQRDELKALNRQLQEISNTKSQVIGLAAQDLQGPLTSILLYCDMLAESPQSPQVGKQVGAIRALGTRMGERIKELLNVNAIEAGQIEAPQIVTMDLCFAAELALARAATDAGEKGIALAFPHSASLEVKGDPAQVGRALDQLLSNAVRFSPSGTTVTILLADDNEQGRILVQDQGPGFTEEDQEKAFGQYIRLGGQSTGGEASVGRGLSLVKRLVEGMGGSVGVESMPGHGATFWIALPRG